MFKNPLSSLKEKITQYVHLKFELIRLEVIERLVNVMGYFAFIMIAIFLFFTFGMFLLFGLAEFLNVVFHSYVWGYLATALFILIVAFIVIGFSKKIIRFFAGKLAVMLTKNFHEDEDEKEEEM